MTSLSSLRRLARFRFVVSLAVNLAPLDHRFNRRLEKLLRDERGYKRAEDDDRHQHGVLRLVNDFVLQAEQGGDRAEGQAGCHEQRRVIRLAVAHVKHFSCRPDADEFRDHFYPQQQHDDA